MSVTNFNDENGEHSYAQDGEKFELFLELLKEACEGADEEDATPLILPQSWAAIARAIGVSQTQVYKWKKSREAQLLTSKGIKLGLKNMLDVGKNDWRMWESYLKMIGLSPIEKQEVTDTSNKTQKKRIIMEIVDQREKDKENDIDKRILLDEASDQG